MHCDNDTDLSGVISDGDIEENGEQGLHGDVGLVGDIGEGTGGVYGEKGDVGL